MYILSAIFECVMQLYKVYLPASVDYTIRTLHSNSHLHLTMFSLAYHGSPTFQRLSQWSIFVMWLSKWWIFFDFMLYFQLLEQKFWWVKFLWKFSYPRSWQQLFGLPIFHLYQQSNGPSLYFCCHYLPMDENGIIQCDKKLPPYLSLGGMSEHRTIPTG
jgi:hypothetical protein